jgi:hypothetical protein
LLAVDGLNCDSAGAIAGRMYADSMERPGKEPDAALEQRSVDAVDPLANVAQARAALARPMSERLELALSWNATASELRAGLDAITRRE